MKDAFEKIVEMHRKNLIYAAWVNETTLLDRFKELEEEVEEAKEEVRNEEWEKFEEEIGDVLWDCIGILTRAEKDGHLNIKNMLDKMHDKYLERKPFLLENRKVTKEEEHKLWQEAKEKQNARNRS